jgi:hypothetical protein
MLNASLDLDHLTEWLTRDRDMKLLARFEKTREKMKQNREYLYDITSLTTTMRRTYVVLTHDVRMSNVNTFNQQKIINQIVKQNSSFICKTGNG